MRSTEPIRIYDANKNLIHFKDSDGYERWWEYDSNGKIIHFKNSDGFELWWEYDSDGKCIYEKDSNGHEAWLWEGKPIIDPIKILLLASQLCSNKKSPLLET